MFSRNISSAENYDNSTIPWELSDWLIYAGAIVMFPLCTYLAVRIVGWTVGWLFAGLAGNEPRD